MEPIDLEGFFREGHLDDLIDADYAGIESRLWTAKKRPKYDGPPSCEEEEGLRVLADADLGEDPEFHIGVDVSVTGRALREGANLMIQSPSLPQEIFVSAATYKELKKAFGKKETVGCSLNVHTGHLTRVAVE